MAFDPNSIFSKVEDWYDNYYIFVGIGILAFIILVIVLLLFYLGLKFGITEFSK